MYAQALWRRFPGEIASDLSQFHRRRIADWHQGVMCSYELLELCDFMPDEGRYKTAARRGERTETQEAVFQTANETAVLRAGMVPSANSEEYSPRLFLPPHKLRELTEKAAATKEARENVYAMADRSSKA